jgi:hypothetical protein
LRETGYWRWLKNYSFYRVDAFLRLIDYGGFIAIVEKGPAYLGKYKFAGGGVIVNI